MRAYVSADPLQGRQDLPADPMLFMLGSLKAVLLCSVLMIMPLPVMFKDPLQKKEAGISSLHIS